jgi:hypothetical protein
MTISQPMKYQKVIALTTSLVSAALIAGCGGDSKKSPPAVGNSPSSLQGHTISVAVTGGAAPFSSTGSYIFSPTSGSGNSGNYQLQGSGGVQSNIGSYTYTKTGNNTASLVETEQSGTVVQNTLSFNSANSGTIHSTSSNANPPTGFENGNFTLN